MDLILSNLVAIILAISSLYYALYIAYYFAVIHSLGDLKEIRNNKIKEMVSKNLKEHQTYELDLFFLIDDLNADNKVWLLDTDKKNSNLKFSLWLFGSITILATIYFLFRSSILAPNLKSEFISFDLVMIIFFIFSLAWALFNLYWDNIYFSEFMRQEKKMLRNDEKSTFIVTRKPTL